MATAAQRSLRYYSSVLVRDSLCHQAFTSHSTNLIYILVLIDIYLCIVATELLNLIIVEMI